MMSVINDFLRACPGYDAILRQAVEQNEGVPPPLSDIMTALAYFIVDSYESGQADNLLGVFDWIEQCVERGDDEVQEAIKFWLLEPLQNIASHRQFGADVFLKWVKPRTRVAWFEVVELWKGKTTLGDVIRAEQEAEMPVWRRLLKRVCTRVRLRSRRIDMAKITDPDLRRILEPIIRGKNISHDGSGLLGDAEDNGGQSSG